MAIDRLDLEINQPTWKRDGHIDEASYKNHMVRLVDDLLEESTRAWKNTKERWMSGDKKLEQESSYFDTSLGVAPTRSDLPIVPQAIEEAIATLVESLPRPTVTSRQESQDQFTGALNMFIAEELDANDFDLLMARVALDIKRFNLGIVKQSLDKFGRGPFNTRGCIKLTRVDPRHIWPDPLSVSFDACRYVIEARPMDLSDVRELFPEAGYKVRAESEFTLSRKGDIKTDEIDMYGTLQGAQSHTIGERQRALVKELWLKDDRKQFIPEWGPDGEILRDSEGDPIGRLEKIYPRGRLVITANGILLLDIPNPFRHGQFPYSFFPGRISPKLLSYGDVELLSRIEDKINQLHKDMLRNARVNMNSPWIVDQHAFDSPKKFHNLTNDPGLVLPVRPGAKVMRLPPAELPQFIFPLIEWLRGVFDDILGIHPVARGQLEKGAQLSADAIASLQGSAGARTRLKSRLFENSLKHLGHLLQWNIRQFYPSGLQIMLDDPHEPGRKVPMEWTEDAAQSDYAVGIQAGSSLPGSKQSMAQLALTLWDHGLLGPKTTLRMMDFPGADSAVAERMQMLQKLAEVNLQAAIKEATGKTNQTGLAGRKQRTVNL